MEILPMLKKFLTNGFAKSFSGISFKKNKNALFAMLLTGILILMCKKTLFSQPQKKDAEKIRSENAVEFNAAECANTESRLCAILEKISGAGKVEVMLTYDSTAEKITISDSKTSVTEEEKRHERSADGVTVMQKNSEGEAPFVKREVYPRVRGVLIVADGGGSETVCANLKRAVCAALDIPVRKVEVLPRKQ